MAPGRGYFSLRQAEFGQGRPAGDPQLRFDQVQTGDGFGDGVLDLQARIGLDEDEPVRAQQEFERAQAAIGDQFGHPDGGGGDRGAGFRRQGRRRGDFEDFLVTALDAALPLSGVADCAGAVADDLHLDMARVADQGLHIDGVGAEGGHRLRPAAFIGGFQFGRRVGHPHAATAAAGDRFDHDRAMVSQHRQGLVQSHRTVAARGHGDVAAHRQIASGGLVAEQLQRVGGRTDKAQTSRGTGTGERRVLTEEAVARMHRVAPGFPGRGDNASDIQIGGRALAAQDMQMIHAPDMQRRGVVLRANANGADAEFGRRSRDPDGDFPAIGDQQRANAHRIVHPGAGQPATCALIRGLPSGRPSGSLSQALLPPLRSTVAE